MDVFETYENLPETAQDCVLAIGNFDGVHRGHQALLQQGRTLAQNMGKKLAVLTFEPHPRKLFRPDDPPFRITPPSLKQERLAAFGIDTLFSVTFDWDFASQSATAFTENVIKKSINPAHIIIGEDFRFGQLRKGSPETFEKMGLNISAIAKIGDETTDILSSGKVREALRAGNIASANNILGWDWEMRGTIVKGDQRGRELGYPTANVRLGDTLHPAYGVYATWAKIVEDGPDAPWMPSATNIGIRPMFEVPVGQIETYIFDFDRDIYDCTLRVKPVERLRGEAKFDNLDDLVAQIAKDCDLSRDVLGSRP